MNRVDFDAIIFDSDGVLVDSEVINVAVERELLAEIGLVYDHETYLSRFVGLANPDFYAELRSDFAGVTDEAFPSDFAEQLLRRLGPRIEAELEPISGVAELIEAFNGSVAVASSAPFDRLRQKLSMTGLISLFTPHVYSVDHVANGKPAPDLFFHAAAKLGVPPERCIVIEDSVHGVMAARAANMTPIGFVGGGHADNGLAARLYENGAQHVASSHAEIRDRLGAGE